MFFLLIIRSVIGGDKYDSTLNNFDVLGKGTVFATIRQISGFCGLP